MAFLGVAFPLICNDQWEVSTLFSEPEAVSPTKRALTWAFFTLMMIWSVNMLVLSYLEVDQAHSLEHPYIHQGVVWDRLLT